MPKKYVGHIELELRNIACFREFRINLKSGEVTEVTGGNGRGKTTLLGMLKANTSGGNCKFPDWLITDCEERGAVIARVDDELTVRRDITAGNTSGDLRLYDEFDEPVNGGKRQAETLRALFGDGTYLNPVDIVSMRPGERTRAIAAALEISPATAADALRNLTGREFKISTREQIFPAIQQAYDTVYELRRQKRSEYESADAQADGVLSFLPAEWLDAKGQVPAPLEPQPLGDIYDRKRAAEVRNAERSQLARDIAELEDWLQTNENRVAGYELQLSDADSRLQAMGEAEDEAELEEQIRKLQLQLAAMQERNRERRALADSVANARETIARNRGTIDDQRIRLKAKQDREFELGGPENVDALQAQIDAHEDRMTIYREALKVHGERFVRYQQVEQLREKSNTLYAEWEALEKRVQELKKLPIHLLDGVPVPIPGMVISGEDILLPDGDALRPFDAFGDADKFRYAARLAMELAPVNILILDGVEKCDEERRLDLYRMAADAGFLVFSTRVTKGPLTINYLSGPDWTNAPESIAN